MSIFVKLCGLCSGADTERAAELNPDALGFVFWPGSKRRVRPENVAAWTSELPASMERVGVFVDAEPDEVRRIAERAGLTIVQLHGQESPEACGELWPRVWKAMSWVQAKIRVTQPYPAEAFVIDSGTRDAPGGTGRTGNWDVAARCVGESPLPVVLAGGLNPGNAVEAIRRVRPWGVDASSGIEIEPGRKDAARMREFVRLCREF